MSVRGIRRENGKVVWEVRWRDGGRNRSRVFDRKRDAQAFDLEVRRRRQLGELDLVDAGCETLAEFAVEWWRQHGPTLERKTQLVYADLFDRHILDRLGALPLQRITPEVVERFKSDLREAGVGDPSVRKTLALLQTILQRAVVWRRIGSNPVAAVRKPPQRRTRAIIPPSPGLVEQMRADLLGRGRIGDATLVCLLAYAGLRPGEALALRWSDIRTRTILVERAVALGEVKDTKTRRVRAVRLLRPLADDLAVFRRSSGNPDAARLLFPRASDGEPQNDFDYRNWRTRVYAPAATRAGLISKRPYDLRHAFVSLLLAEGHSVVDVAAQAGHAPTMTLDTYAHVMAELGGSGHSAEAVIAAARASAVRARYSPPVRPGGLQESDVRAEYASGADAGAKRRVAKQNKDYLQDFSEEPSQGLEPWTPSLPFKSPRRNRRAQMTPQVPQKIGRAHV